MNLILLVLIALHFLVLVIGIIGNVSVIRVVWSTRSMHTTTNYLLANLALADIITLSTNPYLYKLLFNLVLHFSSNRWSLLAKDWLCRLIMENGIVGVFICVSVTLLTVVAVERFNAMVKPLSPRFSIQKEQVWKIVILIWFVSVLLNIPIFIDVEFDPHTNRCISALDMTTYRKSTVVYLAIYFGVNFFIPGVIITVCYLSILKGLLITKSICSATVETIQGQEEKKKLAKLLTSVTVVYYCCFAPFLTFMIYMAFVKILYNQAMNASTLLTNTYLITSSLSLFNSCLNPVLYAFQSSKYRRAFARLFTFNFMKVSRQVGVLVVATDARSRSTIQRQSTQTL
ncbi:somatostatin receptor type 4 [Nematostella vectensis]|uniref:somatostatin receptor type 4 n=1 Tax=Nematostella vectensis TaxID=45351 RepID=UPI00207732D8|nr:somatostatin receptor type 4 [Nematostella vectensis]